MTLRRVLPTLGFLGGSCAALGIGYASIPEAPMLLSPRVATATVWTEATSVADTLIVELRWNLPADDRKGPLDSITVNVSSLSTPGWLRMNVPITAVATAVRQPIPVGDATYDVQAQACTWRRGKATCVHTETRYEHREVPPPALEGLTLSARRA